MELPLHFFFVYRYSSISLVYHQQLKVNNKNQIFYFSNEILRISESIDDMGGIVWPLFTCNTLAWTATYLCMSNGIKTVGKVVYFTATFPFLILLVLLLRGLTLPGAMSGVYFYIYPQWDQLTSFKVSIMPTSIYQLLYISILIQEPNQIKVFRQIY